mmetsp:Transcript_15037/g.38171  ORF Transcript_15037/g.38171 Transcript_15037/m.38171 type:complete len:304 (+) Transcript_15037:50-961(+)
MSLAALYALPLAAAAKKVPDAVPAAASVMGDVPVLSTLVDIALLRGATVMFCIMVGYATWAALKVRGLTPRNAFWGVTFLRGLLAAFGGGIVVPICLGKPPGPFANDMVVSAALVAWFIVQRFPGDYGFRLLGPKGILPLRLLCLFAFETFRANFVITMTELAFQTLKPSFFSIPLWGPLLAGSMAGSFGNFLPFDKGLGPIETGFSWPMISAFFISSTYLCLMHVPVVADPMWKGASFGIPNCERSAETVRVLSVGFLCVVGLLQETGMGPTWHPLKPLTSLLSAIVPPIVEEGPSAKAKKA